MENLQFSLQRVSRCGRETSYSEPGSAVGQDLVYGDFLGAISQGAVPVPCLTLTSNTSDTGNPVTV